MPSEVRPPRPEVARVGTHPHAAMNAPAPRFPPFPAPLGLLAAALLPLVTLPCSAQVESFINKPGSSVGPATKVVPTNCVTAPDGSLTCDTKIENSPSDTQAKPQFSPFRN